MHMLFDGITTLFCLHTQASPTHLLHHLTVSRCVPHYPIRSTQRFTTHVQLYFFYYRPINSSKLTSPTFTSSCSSSTLLLTNLHLLPFLLLCTPPPLHRSPAKQFPSASLSALLLPYFCHSQQAVQEAALTSLPPAKESDQRLL